MAANYASSKPTLALQTPSTANFPKDVLRDIPSAVSVPTPSSTTSLFREPLFSAGLPSAGLPSAGLAHTPTAPQSARIKSEEKTPITPPFAYLDFLRSCSLASPPLTGKTPLNRKSLAGSTASSTNTTDSSASASDQETREIDSAPSTATSENTDCAGDNLTHKTPMMAAAKLKSPGLAPIKVHPKITPINTTALPGSPAANGPRHPLSAPATGPSFPSLNLPASPACSNYGAVNSPLNSPWSARSVQSPFDWDAALKSRRFTEVPGSATAVDAGSIPGTPKTPNAKGTGSKRNSRSTIRHIREVVTRTVTYTPRGGPTPAKTPQVGPAPKGKRRKVDHDTAVET